MSWCIFLLQSAVRFVAILVIAIASNLYLLIVVAVMMVVFLAFRWYYLKTARDIKRLEALGEPLGSVLLTAGCQKMHIKVFVSLLEISSS